MPQDDPQLLFVNYHYVRDPGLYRYPGIHPISMPAFRQQVAWMGDNFRFSTPAQIERLFADGERLPSRAVFPTFDDGLKDHWEAACEVLDPQGIKAGFFVCSRPALEGKALTVHKVHWLRSQTEPERFAREFYDFAGKDLRPSGSEPWIEAANRCYIYDKPPTSWLKFALNFILSNEVVDEITSRMFDARGIDERDFCAQTYMSDDQLGMLRARGHIVGVHGHSHAPFSRLGEALFADVERDVDYLARATGERPTWLAYPYGRKDALPDDAQLHALFDRFGLRLGLTLMGDWNSGGEPPIRLNRVNANDMTAVAKAYAA
jgi:peptidoglycan/xylan/chitin deacetylase (PgdA/CDA1 family)